MTLDIPTLLVVSIFVTAVLGLLLIFAWIQDRSIQALGWWGVAYLLGGLSAGMLSLQQFIASTILIDCSSALLFVACGMSWNPRVAGVPARVSTGAGNGFPDRTRDGRGRGVVSLGGLPPALEGDFGDVGMPAIWDEANV